MQGSVVYLFAFDVANEIRTQHIREILSQKPFPFEIKVGSTVPKEIEIYKPLSIALKPEERDSSAGRITLHPVVKIFDVGIISISYRVPFKAISLFDLQPYHALRLGEEELRRSADRLCLQVADNLRSYLVRPNAERSPAEAYTVFCLEQVDGVSPGGVADWANDRRNEIAALLNEEPVADRISTDQVDETHRHSLSYTTQDLTVIDWDAALVVDQSGYFDDVLYVIELANLQLEEFHLLDERLDRFFVRAYDDLERYTAVKRLLPTPDRILRALRAIRMDVTKMSEEVAHITKFVGDWYLARIHQACRDRFHLDRWEASVDGKLLQLDRLYSLVQSEINERRMLLLEAIIVALFIFDIVALLFR